jgi:hypothetical protein
MIFDSLIQRVVKRAVKIKMTRPLSMSVILEDGLLIGI